MSKHAEGPWVVDAELGYVTEFEHGDVVCDYTCGPFTDATNQANARLIAKSPDMVELLCEVLFCYRYADDLDDRIEKCLQEAMGPENMPKGKS